MASIRKIKSGWQAQIARQGVRASKTFPTKREAQDWAARQEHLILAGEGTASALTFAELLERYARTESPKKKGERWEALRLRKIGRDKIGSVKIKHLAASDLADWRDRRLREVSPASVRREMQSLGRVLTVANKEWGLIGSNPIKDVKKPSPPPRRDRLVTDSEIDGLVAAAGTNLKQAQARAVHAFRFSCVTAMRAGEVCALEPEDVSGSVATLHTSKTGKGREVPLSRAALALWSALPGPGFDLTPRRLDPLFRKMRDRAKITGLTYHDSRHRAISDLAAKVHVLDLARIVGHDDIKMLMTYYEVSAADIALKLD